jgi:hypothetical protein
LRDVRRKAGVPVAADFAHTAGTPVVINTTRGDMSVINDSGEIRTALIAVSGTATLNFPSVAANGMQTLNITVTGAVTKNPVMLAAPETLEAGLTFCGLVISTDTVEVRIHNNSGGSIDPASASWTAYVLL